jgi:NAD+ synthase (glutamine-hydrolysing)
MIIALAQLNPYVGDVEGNLQKMKETLRKYSGKGTDLLVFPELFLVGYPPKRLIERLWFIRKIEEAVEELRLYSRDFPQTGLLFGTPRTTNKGKGLYNSAVLICGGEILLEQHKVLLPSYDLFDENRYFDVGSQIKTVDFKGEKLGVSIGEDAWNETHLWSGTSKSLFDPIADSVKKGATFLINLAASPFYRGKEKTIYHLFSRHVRKHQIPLCYVQQVGANDELIFEGKSLCFNAQAQLAAVLPSFREQILMLDTQKMVVLDKTAECQKLGTQVSTVIAKFESRQSIENQQSMENHYGTESRQENTENEQSAEKQYWLRDEMESVHDALLLGIRDYFRKSGFTKAVLGLSGGIDSALVAYLATKALGKANVLGISMPSPFSSGGSVEDARKLAENLGIAFKVIPIADIYHTYLDTLQAYFMGKPVDITEENIQARIRGNLLMAFSNKFGYLVLTTGNKSELSVGYCTLYGDMSGGLSVISDLPKTMVYQLSRYINRENEIIPNATIEKAPSAELSPEQKDQDTLPPYDLLDRLLELYLVEGLSAQELVQKGFAADTVSWVVRTVERNEYKRRQAVLGLKVNSNPFKMERRMPVVAKRES